jgi:hypothetical protein
LLYVGATFLEIFMGWTNQCQPLHNCCCWKSKQTSQCLASSFKRRQPIESRNFSFRSYKSRHFFYCLQTTLCKVNQIVR